MANPTAEHKLDFEQRSRACAIEEDADTDDLYAMAAEIVWLRDRNELLERLLALASELCVAVDRESEDIGGSRRSLDILQEIGPLTDKLEHVKGAHKPAPKKGKRK